MADFSNMRLLVHEGSCPLHDFGKGKGLADDVVSLLLLRMPLGCDAFSKQEWTKCASNATLALQFQVEMLPRLHWHW